MYVKHSPCDIYCLAHIVGPSFVRVWAGWFVRCHSLVAFSNVVSGFQQCDWLQCVEQKKLLRKEARSEVWDHSSLKKGCCLPEHWWILFFGGCDRASRAVNSCSRSSDREQGEEEVNGMVTMEAFRDTGGELVLQQSLPCHYCRIV